MTSMLMTRSPCGWSNGLRTRPNSAAPARCSLTRVHSMSLSKITAQILQEQRTQAQEQQTHEGVEQLEESDVTAAIRQRPRDFTLVETPKQLRSMLQELAHADKLAVDCEGVNLGQPQGQLCLIQLAARQSSHAAASASTSSGTGSNGSGASAAGSRLKAPAPAHARSPAPSQQFAAAASSASPAQSPPSAGSKKAGRPAPLQIYIVDVHQLQWRAFHYKLDPSDPSSISLKSLLENSQLTKLMYDIRSDAANLVRQFDVRLRGAYDLQLAEVAVRQLRGISAKWLLPLDKSLATCLPRNATLDLDIKHGMHVAKHYHKGGRTQVWQERPLPEELLQYAVGDVRYLHQLADALNHNLPATVVSKVRTATIMRTKMGDLPGVSRASAPEIVRLSDIRQLTERARDQGMKARAQQAS